MLSALPEEQGKGPASGLPASGPVTDVLTKQGSQAMEYRELRRSDLPSFERVVLQSMGEIERATGLDQASISLYQSLRGRGTWTLFTILRSLGGTLGLAPNRIFVGVERGKVLGTATVIMLSDTGYLVGVATDSSARGRGIATHVLEQVRISSQKRGQRWLALDVESENEPAIRVYRRLGYEERARFSWYVGPTPAMEEVPAGAVREVHKSRVKEVAAWVARKQPPGVREPFPATPRRLSHLELITRTPRSPMKTWELSSSGQTVAVVRGSYLQLPKTGFVILPTWDAALPMNSPPSLIAPAANWFRSLGASRTVVIVPDSLGAWEQAMTGLGLRRATSSLLMVRPLPER